jgi:hypothetical protein
MAGLTHSVAPNFFLFIFLQTVNKLGFDLPTALALVKKRVVWNMT